MFVEGVGEVVGVVRAGSTAGVASAETPGLVPVVVAVPAAKVATTSELARPLDAVASRGVVAVTELEEESRGRIVVVEDVGKRGAGMPFSVGLVAPTVLLEV